MKELGPYDTSLQMFVQRPDVNYSRLKFMRWLARHELLEHRSFGSPSGDMVNVITAREGREEVEPKSLTEKGRERYQRIQEGVARISQYEQSIK